MAGEYDGHAGEIFDFGVADYEAVDVEAAGGEDAGHAAKDPGLVLHEAIEDVTFRRESGW